MLAWQALLQRRHLPSPCSALSDCLENMELKSKNSTVAVHTRKKHRRKGFRLDIMLDQLLCVFLLTTHRQLNRNQSNYSLLGTFLL